MLSRMYHHLSCAFRENVFAGSSYPPGRAFTLLHPFRPFAFFVGSFFPFKDQIGWMYAKFSCIYLLWFTYMASLTYDLSVQEVWKYVPYFNNILGRHSNLLVCGCGRDSSCVFRWVYIYEGSGSCV